MWEILLSKGVEHMDGMQFKQTLREGGRVYGTMITASRNPRWGRTISEMGLDYVIVDTEHTARSWGELADLLQLLGALGVLSIVRIPIADSHYVTMAMDAGAQGVLAPYCETVRQVKDVVGGAKWLPLKGKALERVLDFGEFPSDDTRIYLEKRNRNSVVLIGIESVAAVENLENILAVPGIDGIFVGPNDMSITMGIPNQYNHPDYEAMLRYIISVCEGHGVPVLIHHQNIQSSGKWIREGTRIILHSKDSAILGRGAADEFGELRKIGEEL